MSEPTKNQPVKKPLKILLDVGKAVLIIAVLYYTGILPAVSNYLQVALIQSGLKNAEAETQGAPHGKVSYNFTLNDIDGQSISFHAFKGKVVFFNIWATWCGPCRAEMGEIQNLYDQADKDKIAFVLLSVDQGDNSIQKIKRYFNSQGYTLPVYLQASTLPDELSVSSIPTTLVIDQEGNIVFKKSGTANYNTNKFKKFLRDLAAS